MKKLRVILLVLFISRNLYAGEPLRLFIENVPTETNKDLTAKLGKEILIVRLDLEVLSRILFENPDQLNLIFPVFGKGDVEVVLEKNEVLNKGFIAGVYTGKGEETLNYTPGLYYKGKISGEAKSVVGISLFHDQVIGILSDQQDGNVVIGTLKDEKGNPTTDYVIYVDNKLNITNNFRCSTDESSIEEPGIDDFNHAESLTSNCVKIYFECDYEMYVDNGSNVANVLNFVTGMFNNIAILYSNEQINTLVSSVFIWTTPDPYMNLSSSSDYLITFRNTRTSFVGDVAHFLSMRSLNLGGIAYLNTLCNSSISYSFTNIYNFYSAFPFYSWTIGAVTHELGHNMGSPHTHACAWNGNNTAIDGCGPAAGYPYEGNCSGAPIPSSGGTIMSYCHLLGVGVNFNNGFGPQPGNLIREKVSNAVCLVCACNPTVSVSASSCLDKGVVANYTYGGNAPVFQWKKNGANVGTNSPVYLDLGLASGDQVYVVMTSNAACTTASPVTSNVVTINGAFCYCNTGLYSSGGCTDFDLIDNFSLANLNHLSSGCSGGMEGYGNFTVTQPMINMTFNTNYQWTMTCPTPFNEYVSIWIDANNNHQFTDPGELVYMSTSPSSSNNLSGSFTLPNTLGGGQHLLRVRLNYGNSMGLLNACTTYSFGETHDYNCFIFSPVTVNPLASGYCAGSPIVIGYTTTVTFPQGNIFRAQISNAFGSFSPPTNIGSVLSSVSGTINGTLPSFLLPGTGYRIRIISNTPTTIGSDNGVDIQIGNNNFPITASSNSPRCSGSTLNLSVTAASAYAWTGPNAYSSSQQNPVLNNVTVNQAGNYGVTVTNNLGCTSTANTNVIVNQSINYYADSDGDGFGNNNVSQQLCAPSGIYVVTVGGDCNDDVNSIHPGSTEICGNGIDDNCNNQIDEGCIVSLSLRLFLQGYYTGGGLMDNYGAGGGLYLLQNPGSVQTDVDTVYVSAMNVNSPYVEVNTQKGILQIDGTVNVVFSATVFSSSSYYIRVRHRNSIETWSRFPVTFLSNTNYDFTTSNSKAYNDGSMIPMKLVDTGPDRWAIYAGDIDQDGGVTSLDMTLEELNSNAGIFGYYSTDLNGDGASNSLDMTLIEMNTNLGVFSARP